MSAQRSSRAGRQHAIGIPHSRPELSKRCRSHPEPSRTSRRTAPRCQRIYRGRNRRPSSLRCLPGVRRRSARCRCHQQRNAGLGSCLYRPLYRPGPVPERSPYRSHHQPCGVRRSGEPRAQELAVCRQRLRGRQMGHRCIVGRDCDVNGVEPNTFARDVLTRMVTDTRVRASMIRCVGNNTSRRRFLRTALHSTHPSCRGGVR